jgi:nicotinamidase-related amidase
MKSTDRFNSQENGIRPENCVLILVDYQTLLLLGIQPHDRTQLSQNIVGLAKAARAFEVPTVQTTMAASDFGGPLIPELRRIFPDLRTHERTSINAWEDEELVSRVKEFRRKNLIIAGLWTELSVSLPALSALENGYNVYFVADSCGAVSAEAHQIAIQELLQAGARPRTWQQLLFVWQRDWACLDTAQAVQDIIRAHGSAFPPSAIYTRGASIASEAGRVLEAPRRSVRPVGMGKSS